VGQESTVPANQPLINAFHELIALLRAKPVPDPKDPFKINALVKVVNALAEHKSVITCGKDVKDLAGVGKSSQSKIDEFMKTGTFSAIADLKAEAPEPVMGESAKMAFALL